MPPVAWRWHRPHHHCPADHLGWLPVVSSVVSAVTLTGQDEGGEPERRGDPGFQELLRGSGKNVTVAGLERACVQQ